MKKRLLITIFTAIALVFALNKSFAQCDVIVVTDDEPYFDDFEASENFVCWQTEIVSGIDGCFISNLDIQPQADGGLELRHCRPADCRVSHR